MADDALTYDHLYKMLLLGDSGVGKSCILLRFTDDTFTESYIATIGVDFKVRTLDLDGTRVKLQIWDTAGDKKLPTAITTLTSAPPGQERFRTITESYFRGAHGVVLVYDVTDKLSFDNVRNWLDQVNNSTAPDVQKIIVGNKADMAEKRVVSPDMGKGLADELGLKFFEASAKAGTNVQEIFHTIAKDIMEKIEEEGGPSKAGKEGGGIDLDKPVGESLAPKRRFCLI